MDRHKILIVDDSKINQEILADIVSNYYDVEFADNGDMALNMVAEKGEEYYSLMLLDLVMPGLDGFCVLLELNKQGLLEHLPVIMISSETDEKQIEFAFDLGVVDFINRPFDERIVLRRISNTIGLFLKKKSLEQLVVQQFFEKEKNNQSMIDVLANIVEFRNGESSAHIIHIRAFTTIILSELKKLSQKYELDSEMMTYIINASSLHDIGKISIPSEILNKPGRLTDEEFAVMKEHSQEGAKILEASEAYKTSRFLKIARDICRWHHERYDGRGYPDGLKGDEIPIGAQVVALADVYDALTSERCYKSAFSHEKAIEMIINGECGVFNPDLINVLKVISPLLKDGFDEEYLKKIENEEISNTARIMLGSMK